MVWPTCAAVALFGWAIPDFTGSVISVLDCDTIEVLHDRKAERIRLRGIDCPGKGQAYGHKVKQVTSDLMFGKGVTFQTHGKDKYTRTIADVHLANGTAYAGPWRMKLGHHTLTQPLKSATIGYFRSLSSFWLPHTMEEV